MWAQVWQKMKNDKVIPRILWVVTWSTRGHWCVSTNFIHIVGAHARSRKHEMQLKHRDAIHLNKQSTEDVDPDLTVGNKAGAYVRGRPLPIFPEYSSRNVLPAAGAAYVRKDLTVDRREEWRSSLAGDSTTHSWMCEWFGENDANYNFGPRPCNQANTR